MEKLHGNVHNVAALTRTKCMLLVVHVDTSELSTGIRVELRKLQNVYYT